MNQYYSYLKIVIFFILWRVPLLFLNVSLIWAGILPVVSFLIAHLVTERLRVTNKATKGKSEGASANYWIQEPSFKQENKGEVNSDEALKVIKKYNWKEVYGPTNNAYYSDTMGFEKDGGLFCITKTTDKGFCSLYLCPKKIKLLGLIPMTTTKKYQLLNLKKKDYNNLLKLFIEGKFKELENIAKKS